MAKDPRNADHLREDIEKAIKFLRSAMAKVEDERKKGTIDKNAGAKIIVDIQNAIFQLEGPKYS